MRNLLWVALFITPQLRAQHGAPLVIEEAKRGEANKSCLVKNSAIATKAVYQVHELNDDSAPPGYTVKGIFPKPKNKNGYFAVLYAPMDPQLVPILAIKGSSTREDWQVNLKSQGGEYLVGLLNNLGKKPQSDPLLKSLDSYQNVEIVGHSLGGGLAQSFARHYAQENPEKKIKVTTFNTLGALAPQRYLNKKVPSRSMKEEEFFKLPSNISVTNLHSLDDNLIEFNRRNDYRNLGETLFLPSKEVFKGTQWSPRTMFRGHKLDSSIFKDLEFNLERGEEAQAWSKNQIQAIEKSVQEFLKTEGPTPDSLVEERLTKIASERIEKKKGDTIVYEIPEHATKAQNLLKSWQASRRMNNSLQGLKQLMPKCSN